MSRKERSRFYDGRLYRLVMDRLLSGLHGVVAAQVPPGGAALDVGCGTGAVALRLAAKAAKVVGVELSPRMVAEAQRLSERAGADNVSFVLGDAAHALADRPDGTFDVATMVLALHEMPADARGPVLCEVTRLAERLLCVDFGAPMPRNFAGLRNRTLEVIAGAEHYRAFRDYTRRGGVPGLAHEAGLTARHVRSVDGRSVEIWEVRR